MALVWDTRLRMPERRGEDEGGGVDSFDMLSFEFLSFLSLLGDESNAIRSSDRSYLSDTISQHDASKVRFEIPPLLPLFYHPQKHQHRLGTEQQSTTASVSSKKSAVESVQEAA